MRLAHVNILVFNWRDVRHPRAGGAEKYLHEMSRRWVADGDTVTWITARFRGATKRADIDGIHVVRTGNAVTVYLCAAIAYLKDFRGRVDRVVDAENGIPFFTPLFVREPILALIFHVHVRVFRSQLPWPISEFFVWIETRIVPWLYRRRRYVTISTTSRDEMLSYKLTAEAVPIVFPGVDLVESDVVRAQTPRIVSVGRLEPYKRVDVLVEIMAGLMAEHTTLHFDVVGVGSDSTRLKNLARLLGVDKSVTFHGYLSDAAKADVLAAGWIFVSASSMEGWGIVVIEANALGTPAVVFDVPGLSESVVDEQTGFVVRTAEEFSAAIVRIVDQPVLRERLGAAAKRRATEFSWDSAAAKFKELLTECRRV